jgi:toxin ParE1/3/4
MRIAWSEPALADLAAIHDYIARDSAHYAQRFVARLIAAVEPLENFSQLGRIVPS